MVTHLDWRRATSHARPRQLARPPASQSTPHEPSGSSVSASLRWRSQPQPRVGGGMSSYMSRIAPPRILVLIFIPISLLCVTRPGLALARNRTSVETPAASPSGEATSAVRAWWLYRSTAAARRRLIRIIGEHWNHGAAATNLRLDLHCGSLSVCRTELSACRIARRLIAISAATAGRRQRVIGQGPTRNHGATT